MGVGGGKSWSLFDPCATGCPKARNADGARVEPNLLTYGQSGPSTTYEGLQGPGVGMIRARQLTREDAMLPVISLNSLEVMFKLEMLPESPPPG